MRVLSDIWVVFAKEVVDNLRDRRSITMAAIYPVIGPLLLGVMLAFAQNMFRPDKAGEPTPFELAVEGQEYAPELMSFLEGEGVVPTPAPPDMERAVREGITPLVVVILPDYVQSFAEERTATITIVVDATQLSTVMTISRTLGLLRAYGRDVSNERMHLRGVSSGVANPIKIENRNVGKTRSLAGFFLNMIPPFLIFTIFIGGVYLALDTTSGERERGSLEPLLINPLARWEFMMGKVFAALAFTIGAVIIQLIAFKIMFELVIDKDLGVRVDPEPVVFVKILLVALPMMLLAVALQIIVAAMTRSFKETQTYLGLLPLIPSLPGLVLVFVAVKGHLWMMSIPTFSQVVLIAELVRGDPVSSANVLVSVVTTLAIAGGMLVIAGRLYGREELLFSA